MNHSFEPLVKRPVPIPSRPRTLSRRDFAGQLVKAGVGIGLLPAILRAQEAPGVLSSGRPRIVSGVMTGDVSRRGAVFWSRTDRPSTMLLEVSTTDSFREVRRLRGPAALAETDFAAKLLVPGLAHGQKIFYRVSFEDIAEPKLVSESVTGSLLMPPEERRDILFAWSGDTAGQGFGIDLSRGGMRTYETIRRMQPDFFVHSGDTIYADVPIEAELKLDDGTVWKNIVTEAKSKVAETVEDFRGNHFYNMLDENVRRFHAEVPVYYQWDDHEVANNWYPGETLDDKHYTERRASLLAAYSRRAFFECLPIRPHPREQIFRHAAYGPSLELFLLDERSYRGPNSPNQQEQMSGATAFLGRAQLNALKQALLRSKATWKVFCSDMPIGLMIRDGRTDFENCANGDGPPLGRELEIAELLRFLREHQMRNTIWLTADVHHAASVYYDPAKADFKEFDPFWEFITGPLHAGTFGHPPLDNTFGPETRFLGIPKNMKGGRSPSDGYQFFGTVHIDGKSEELTVTHWNVAGEKLWSITLEPGKQ